MINIPLSIIITQTEDGLLRVIQPYARTRMSHCMWALVYQLHYEHTADAYFTAECIRALR